MADKKPGLSPGYMAKATKALSNAKKTGNTTMSPGLLWDTISEVATANGGSQHPAFQLAKKLHDKFPEKFGEDKNTVGRVKYKKGGKVKKAKCRDGIAIRGKTKGTIR